MCLITTIGAEDTVASSPHGSRICGRHCWSGQCERSKGASYIPPTKQQPSPPPQQLHPLLQQPSSPLQPPPVGATVTLQAQSRSTEWRRRVLAEEGHSRDTVTVPKTTAWRKRKLEDEGQSVQKKSRRVKCCSVCGQPQNATTGHTQFKGQIYCPQAHPELRKEQWLQQKRAAAKADGATVSTTPPE